MSIHQFVFLLTDVGATSDPSEKSLTADTFTHVYSQGADGETVLLNVCLGRTCHLFLLSG